MKKILIIASLLAICGTASAIDTGAAVGGGIGGATGAVIGKEMGGKNGAILGAAIGGAAGAAIGAKDDKKIVPAQSAQPGKRKKSPRHPPKKHHDEGRHEGHDRGR